MKLDITYEPTGAERRRALGHSAFSWLVYAGLAGAVFALFGIGALSRAAGRHGEPTGLALLAALGGMLLMFLPLWSCLRAVQNAFGDRAERRLSITDARIRLEREGMASEFTWDEIYGLRETSHEWALRARAAVLTIPKRAVPSERTGELEAFLRERCVPSTPAER
jgi:hypothetical protein